MDSFRRLEALPPDPGGGGRWRDGKIWTESTAKYGANRADFRFPQIYSTITYNTYAVNVPNAKTRQNRNGYALVMRKSPGSRRWGVLLQSRGYRFKRILYDSEWKKGSSGFQKFSVLQELSVEWWKTCNEVDEGEALPWGLASPCLRCRPRQVTRLLATMPLEIHTQYRNQLTY